MPKQLENLPLSARDEFAGVPFIDQYVGAWALWEPHARVLLGQVENLNVQLHLEQRAASSEQRETKAVTAVATSGLPSDLYVQRDGIAVIELRGTLMKHASSMSGGTSTVRARRQMRAAAASDEVTGILLVIDSPGGTVAGTSDLAADIRAAGNKKPLFAYIEDLGASAAYWQASQAHRISAGESAIVGSIGVFSVVYDLSKMAEQDGVKVHVVRFGEFKGAGTPGTEITEAQLERWQRLVDAHGDDFVSAVAAGRRLPTDSVRKLANGDVWKGAAAQQAKLIDEIESLDETLAKLVAETKKSKSRGMKMSEEPTKSTPAAATLIELREACPGAPSDFLLAQLEKGATVAAAMKAHMQALLDGQAKLAEENNTLKAKAESKSESKPKRGNEPIGGDVNDDQAADRWDGLSANEFAQLEIQKRVDKGMARDRAAANVFAANPGLREAMIVEANNRRAA